MNILVDTHLLVWVVGGEDSKISADRVRLLKDLGNSVYASQISLMELAIKKALGKLPELVASIAEITQTWLNNGYEILPLKDEHIIRYERVPLFPEHRDPFDRFILATAMQEQMTVMTDDQKFHLYGSLVQLV